MPIKDDSSWLENQGSLLRADVQWPVHSFRFSLPGLPTHIRLTPESAAVSGGGSTHSEIPSWPRHPSQLQGGLLRRLGESWVISARVAKPDGVHVRIPRIFSDSPAQLHKSGVQSNCQALLELR